MLAQKRRVVQKSVQLTHRSGKSRLSPPNRKGAFEYLTLPITPSDVTFATGSLFNSPMILSRPLVGIWHARDTCT